MGLSRLVTHALALLVAGLALLLAGLPRIQKEVAVADTKDATIAGNDLGPAELRRNAASTASPLLTATATARAVARRPSPSAAATARALAATPAARATALAQPPLNAPSPIVVLPAATGGAPHYIGAVYGPPNPFPWGYCTWWVAHRRAVPWNGDAWQWWGNARAMGYSEGEAPRVGAIMVIGRTYESPVGHVAYVESVGGDGSFTVSEMNYGAFGVEDLRTIPSTYGIGLLGFIY